MRRRRLVLLSGLKSVQFDAKGGFVKGMRLPQIGNEKPPRGTAVGKRPDLNRGLLHQGHSQLCATTCLVYIFPSQIDPVNHLSLASQQAHRLGACHRFHVRHGCDHNEDDSMKGAARLAPDELAVVDKVVDKLDNKSAESSTVRGVPLIEET